MSDHEHNHPGNDNDTDRIGLPGGNRSESGDEHAHTNDDPQPGHGKDDEHGHHKDGDDGERIGLPGGN